MQCRVYAVIYKTIFNGLLTNGIATTTTSANLNMYERYIKKLGFLLEKILPVINPLVVKFTEEIMLPIKKAEAAFIFILNIITKEIKNPNPKFTNKTP